MRHIMLYTVSVSFMHNNSSHSFLNFLGEDWSSSCSWQLKSTSSTELKICKRLWIPTDKHTRAKAAKRDRDKPRMKTRSTVGWGLTQTFNRCRIADVENKKQPFAHLCYSLVMNVKLKISPCRSKPVWLHFTRRTQEQEFWRMLQKPKFVRTGKEKCFWNHVIGLQKGKYFVKEQSWSKRALHTSIAPSFLLWSCFLANFQ